MNAPRTPWFAASTGPVRPSACEYKGEGLNGIVELNWNGWTWGTWTLSEGGLPVRMGYTSSAGDSWRGVAEEP